jgi:DNA-directed RNA polymerase subunit RPC12/RpoP
MADSSWMSSPFATGELSRAALTLPGMNILLDCAGCGDEVLFSVDEADDELVCSACNIRTAFAPDPATTFALLYESARAA